MFLEVRHICEPAHQHVKDVVIFDLFSSVLQDNLSQLDFDFVPLSRLVSRLRTGSLKGYLQHPLVVRHHSSQLLVARVISHKI